MKFQFRAFIFLALLPNLGFGQSNYVPQHRTLPIVNELSEKQKLEDKKYLNSLSPKAKKEILEVRSLSKLKSSSEGFYGDQVLNVFVRPNYKNAGEEHTDFPGSGDGDCNGTVNNTDVDVINSGEDNYRTKILGNVSTSPADANRLEAFLNGELSNIPSLWRKLSPEEKVDWFLQMYNNHDQSHNFVEGKNCYYYSGNYMIVGAGIEKILESGYDLDEIVDIEKNAYQNLQIYQVSTEGNNGDAHSIIGFFKGTNNPETNTPENFYAWYFFDPKIGERVSPGHNSMRGDAYAKIQRYGYNDFLGYFDHFVMPIIDFDLEGNVPVAITYQNGGLVTKPDNEPPVRDPVTGGWSDESSFEVIETNISTRGENPEECNHWKYENIKTQTATDVYKNSAVFEETDFVDLSAKPEVTSFPNDTAYIGKGEALLSPDILKGWPKYSHLNGAPVNISYRDEKNEEESDATKDVWYRYYEGKDPCDETSGERARKITLEEGVGIGDLSHNHHIKIYPNPATDFINIEFDESLFLHSPNSFEIRISGINGTLYMSHPITPTHPMTTIPIKNLPTGTLLLQVYQNGKLIAVKKIIKVSGFGTMSVAA